VKSSLKRRKRKDKPFLLLSGKHRAMNRTPLLALVTLSLCPALSHAEEVAPPTPAAPVTATPVVEKFLSTRGEFTMETLLRDGGLGNAPMTPEARQKLERALQKRNEALRRANARFAEEMQRALAVTDKEFAQRVEEEKDRHEMERIKKYQPMRYDAIMRQRKKKK
jgi:hypothetical protein